MIQKFRKKPVVIEAIQLTAGNVEEVYEFINGKVNLPSDFSHYAHDAWDGEVKEMQVNGIKIRTLESHDAPLTASIGDYVIKGIQGEFYPCKPDIFEATYEPVNS